MSPPGVSTAAASGRHSHGASMSRITRSKEALAGGEPAGTVREKDSRAAAADRSPVSSRHHGGASPKYRSTFPRAIAAKSGRRSKETSVPAGPIARSSQQDSAPDPAPASSTRAPGKMSA